jgi:hypothetical protein
VGERGEVSAGADAALRRNVGRDAVVQHFAERIDDEGADAGAAFGEGVGAKEHHGAGFGDGERVADADGVGANEVDLQFADLIADDANVAELADSGGDGVGEFVVSDDVVDDGAGEVDCGAGIGGELDGAVVSGDFVDLFEC